MSSPQQITIRRPDDYHVHFRYDALLALVAPHTARVFGRAVIRPNDPEILTAGQLVAYEQRIRRVTDPFGFRPLTTIKLTHSTTPQEIELAREQGASAAKLYPRGVTHGSAEGIDRVADLDPVFLTMEQCGMVLCVHAEWPSSFILDRESDYLPTVRWIVETYPTLKVVLEHISTREAALFVSIGPNNLAATVTPVHLTRTLDDVLGPGLCPHNYMKPIPKRPDDRRIIRHEVCRPGQTKFFAGTDSAPHRRERKESACGCAGVFSAPVALPTYAEVFEAAGHRDWVADLERFCSRNGADFYGLPYNEGTVTLVREDWVIPLAYRSPPPHWGKANPLDESQQPIEVVPFRAGETLPWKVVVAS